MVKWQIEFHGDLYLRIEYPERSRGAFSAHFQPSSLKAATGVRGEKSGLVPGFFRDQWPRLSQRAKYNDLQPLRLRHTEWLWRAKPEIRQKKGNFLNFHGLTFGESDLGLS